MFIREIIGLLLPGMTEALAEELRMERRTGVRVTAVHPFLISNVKDVTPNVR